MKLVLESLSWSAPTVEETIYETGRRTSDLKDLKKVFDEQVEEEEADSFSLEVLLNHGKGVKEVPVTKGTYPTEYNSDKKVLSSKAKPSAEEVFKVAKNHPNPKVRQQLIAMLFSDSIWLAEILDKTLGDING